MEQTNQVTKFSNLNPQTLEELKEFGDKILKSGLTPLKTGDAIMVAISYGRELGLDPMTSVNNIYPIEGRATIGIHIINALLQKAGVVVEVLRSYEPCVAFALKGEDGKSVKNSTGAPTLTRIDFVDIKEQDYEVKGTQIVDYKTVIKLTRKLKQPDGTFEKVSVVSSFSYTDSVTAELSNKSNWKKYPKQMALTRATALGGRLIAADVLLGVYETSELADTHNIPYNTTEEGKVTVLESTSVESNQDKGKLTAEDFPS